VLLSYAEGSTLRGDGLRHTCGRRKPSRAWPSSAALGERGAFGNSTIGALRVLGRITGAMLLPILRGLGMARLGERDAACQMSGADSAGCVARGE